MLLGTFNALPMKPLDGGYVFKDGMDSLIKRIKKGLTRKKREHYVNVISNFIAFLFLILILWTLIIPRIL